MIKDLIDRLREHAEWASANEWETPITLADDLFEVIGVLEAIYNLPPSPKG